MTVVSMVEHPQLGWIERINYLAAKEEQRQIELYGMDIVWKIACHYYNGLPQPSEVAYKRHKVDRRTGKQIVDDLLKSMGGE